MDESITTFLTGLLLQSTVFGPISVLPALLYMFGRVNFCNIYKNGGDRSKGFIPAIVAESSSAALVGLCAVKGIAGPLFPI